ncbi:GNAT family N-acetyltransferase [Agrobacterium tumefaciens]|uniref:GNAT family N-acetyltransferase n=1 Tax=Agrobacterium tumefaciens TaxID=358 RepID=UPI001E637672|nr:GNAT family N-acetyltransferase [Agrobacterium tumefaciens]
MAIDVEVERSPSEDTRRLIDEGLDTYNAEKAGPDNAEDLWIIARDDDRNPCGGLKGRTFYSWMFIDWLWVSPSVRGGGIGERLLVKAERVAQERGCIGAYVDTFSFQAPDFYRQSGYEEFGRIDGLPPGHACIWLKKTFAVAQKS